MTNQYKAVLADYQSQPDLEAFKHFIVDHVSEWDWEGESLVNDLLADHTMTADDLLEFLLSAKMAGEGNGFFRKAVSAMEAHVRRTELSHRVEVDEKSLGHFMNNDEGIFLDPEFGAAILAG